MSDSPPPSPRWVFLPAILIPTWALVLGTFALPAVRGDGALADLAYWVSFSGKELLVLPALVGAAIVVSAPAFVSGADTRGLRLRWGLGALLLAAGAVGGGALFNEYALKRTLAVPRPFVKRLAQEGTLGMTPEEFYALGDKEARRAHLRQVLTPAVTPDLSERLRAHWIVETGYSFPSGHSYAASSCAALFVAWGLLTGVAGWRRLALAAFLPWGLFVCYSRPLLGVHSPLDVTVGCALGFTFGTAAALVLHALRRRGTGSPA